MEIAPLRFCGPSIAAVAGSQRARTMIMKLASATATASQLVGKADLETSIVGSGMIETAPIAVK